MDFKFHPKPEKKKKKGKEEKKKISIQCTTEKINNKKNSNQIKSSTTIQVPGIKPIYSHIHNHNQF